MLNLKETPRTKSEKTYGVLFAVFSLAFFVGMLAFVRTLYANDVGYYLNGNFFIVTVLFLTATVWPLKSVVGVFRQFTFFKAIKAVLFVLIALAIWGLGFEYLAQGALDIFKYQAMAGDKTLFYFINPLLQVMLFKAVISLVNTFRLEREYAEEVHKKTMYVLSASTFLYMLSIAMLSAFGSSAIIAYGMYAVYAPIVWAIYLIYRTVTAKVVPREGDEVEADEAEPTEESSSEEKKPFYIRAYTRGLKGAYNFLEKIKPKV